MAEVVDIKSKKPIKQTKAKTRQEEAAEEVS